MQFAGLHIRMTIIVAIVLLAAAALARAGGKVEPVNRNLFGTAVKGYDVVAYFTDGKAVKGSSEFRHDWMGAKWYFVSAARRDEFAKSPEKYAPQYGGYCAWAVSNNYTADIDPEAWKIVNGKLYLNYNRDVQKMWEKDQSERIKKADANWPGLHR
ncbi:MAG TPA: YHS domain-containing (seleno)protein [Blastocatellia bacterium]|nr:YHS domain-containing (seleno)protein [Blastocatellia bacterium]